MLRPLEISQQQIEAVKHVVNFASQKENWYCPTRDKWVPGDRIEYCLHLNTYRTVFTYTAHETKLYRHLTISIAGPNYPHPTAAFTIAKWFEFTGGVEQEGVIVKEGLDWGVRLNPLEHCVTLIQIIREEHDLS